MNNEENTYLITVDGNKILLNPEIKGWEYVYIVLENDFNDIGTHLSKENCKQLGEWLIKQSE